MSTTSEQAVLGHCLWNPDEARQLLAVVPPGTYAGSGHNTAANLIAAMLDAQLPIEPTTVAARLARSPEAHLYYPNAGAWCATLLQAAPRDLGAAMWHAIEVRKAWILRESQYETRRVADVLAEADDFDSDMTMESTAGELHRIADRLATGGQAGPANVPHLGALLADRPPPITWRVPWLISEHDKLIWTGLEGLGKSEFGAMLAVCAAAGMQPFSGELHEPQRILVYDLENERDSLLRRYWRLTRAVDRVSPEGLDRSLIHLRSVEAGIDITRPDDFSRLRRDIDSARPGILLIGPLSKIARGHNLNDEESAVALCGQLDRLRVEHNLATLTEAHPSKEKGFDGKRAPAPRGSSYFLGWPAVGFGMRPHADNGEAEPTRILELKQFRGAREERRWPDGLVRMEGTDELPSLPFGPKWDKDRQWLRAVR